VCLAASLLYVRLPDHRSGEPHLAGAFAHPLHSNIM
jgi:hypothetical protein